jgi:hypothetical protein
MNEFGGTVTDRQRRAMFAALRERGGKARSGRAPVILGNHWRARPYLYPAVFDNEQRFIDILREALIK